MELLLNGFAFLFVVLVAFGIITATWNPKSEIFWIRSIVLLVPVIAELRQILSAFDLLISFPVVLYLAYFFLRCLGPLLNWYTHKVLNIKISYFGILNISAYLLLAYVLYDFTYSFTLDSEVRIEYLKNSFGELGWFSLSYPILQIMHISQAIYLVLKNRKDIKRGSEGSFISLILISSFFALFVLQLAYFVFNRQQVELLIAPILFIFVYSVALFISIKFSSIYRSPSDQNNILKELSQRENHVLQLLAKGRTDKEIAHELEISINTVQTYCKRIYEKLKIGNRTEAAIYYNKNVNN